MTWTAYYAPAEVTLHKSGFVSKEAAQSWTRKQTEDQYAWFFLKTEVFEKCEEFEDIMAAAGYRPKMPSHLLDSPEHKAAYIERVKEHVERCKRLGILDEYLADEEQNDS